MADKIVHTNFNIRNIHRLMTLNTVITSTNGKYDPFQYGFCGDILQDCIETFEFLVDAMPLYMSNNQNVAGGYFRSSDNVF